MTWLASLAASLISSLASKLFAWALEHYHSYELEKKTEADVDAKLKTFKDAYAAAFNGDPLNKDDRSKLKSAISDFLRNNTGGM